MFNFTEKQKEKIEWKEIEEEEWVIVKVNGRIKVDRENKQQKTPIMTL